MNIANSQKVVAAVAQIIEDVCASVEDKKVNIADLWRIVPSLGKYSEAAQALAAVPAELRDLDAQEKQALLATFTQELDLPNDKVEEAIEGLATAVAAIAQVVQAFQ